MEIQTIKHNKSKKVSIISFSVFLVLYLGMSIFFSTHFNFGSTINGINASGKTVEELDKEISTKFKTYTLELQERNGVKEQIKASEIGLKYNSNGKIKILKDTQNSFTWIISLFSPKTTEVDGLVTYDKNLLQKRFDKLSCLDSKKIIEPQNASFKYSNAGYVIVKEVNGNKTNNKSLYSNVENAILKGETTINLEAKNYYINPKYTSSSKEVINTKILLNKYITSKITYTSTGGKEVLNGSTIITGLALTKTLQFYLMKTR